MKKAAGGKGMLIFTRESPLIMCLPTGNFNYKKKNSDFSGKMAQTSNSPSEQN